MIFFIGESNSKAIGYITPDFIKNVNSIRCIFLSMDFLRTRCGKPYGHLIAFLVFQAFLLIHPSLESVCAGCVSVTNFAQW